MSESAAEVVLRADGVTAGYGGPPIIEDVSVRVPAGKITAIVGPNGGNTCGPDGTDDCCKSLPVPMPGAPFKQIGRAHV